jgi:hypothetical protein
VVPGQRFNRKEKPMYKSGDSQDAGPLAPFVAAQETGHPSAGQLMPLLIRHQLRQLRRWLDAFERDSVLPILLGEIALHNIGARQNGTADLSCVPDDGTLVLRPCNAYSIASGTNLPRETVRRKIARLIELGWVRKSRHGHLYITTAAHQHFVPLLYQQCLPELLEIAAASAGGSDRAPR